MNTLITLCLMAFVAGAYAQSCPKCKNMKWATCDGASCDCRLALGDTEQQTVDCNQLVAKCFLMKAEMYRRSKNLDTRSGGKPVETALVDNDGIYDPKCENDGKFKAVQCNNTETCWCVNSAGVRRSDKGDKNIKCEPADTYWVRLELRHPANVTASSETAKWRTAFENILLDRYNLDKKFVKEFQYDKDSRMIVVDVKKEIGDASTDLPRMAYYMEKDVKVSPLFSDKKPFLPSVEGTLVPMESILVYYVDDKAPTITMQRLTGGVIAVIVVVVLAVLIGLLVLFFMRRRDQAKYSKAQPREMENMS